MDHYILTTSSCKGYEILGIFTSLKEAKIPIFNKHIVEYTTLEEYDTYLFTNEVYQAILDDCLVVSIQAMPLNICTKLNQTVVRMPL